MPLHTRDGQTVIVRPLRSDDAAALDELHAHVGDASYRFRFFNPNRLTGHEYAAHLVRDTTTSVSLVALLDGALVGVATAELIDPETAEMAFLVADAAQGAGVGTLLLEELADVAGRAGIDRLVADVLTENARMLEVLVDAGFGLTRQQSRGVTRVVMDVAATPRSVAARAARRGGPRTR